VAALTVGALLWRPSGSASTFAPREPILATPLRVAFETGLDSLIVALDSLQATTAGNDRSRSLAAFRSTRTDYKRVEGLVEYFAPGVAGFLNCPLPDDDGDAPPRPLGAPAAFQRVEVALAGDVPMAGGSTPRGPLKVDVVAMRRVVVTLRAEMQFISVGELEMLDAARLEIARVTTLGLAGVDAVRRTTRFQNPPRRSRGCVRSFGPRQRLRPTMRRGRGGRLSIRPSAMLPRSCGKSIASTISTA